MGGLGAREREAVGTVEGAFFESVWLVLGSGRHARDIAMYLEPQHWEVW